MKLLLRLSTALIISAVLFVEYTESQCNRCFQTNVACLDQTHFALCRDGVQLSLSTPCTLGKVCTDDTLICRSPEDGYEAACFVDYCGSCQFTNGRFGCLDETSYAFCYGQMEPPLNAVHKCPSNTVCNIHSTAVCTPAETSVPSCAALNGGTTAITSTDTTVASTASPTITTTDTTAASTTITSIDATVASTASPTITTTDTTAASTTITSIDATVASTASPTITTTDTTVASTTKRSTDTTIASTTITSTDTPVASTASPSITTTDTTVASTTKRSADTTIASTPSPAPIPTTPAPRDADAFCANLQQEGRFRAEGDTTCKAYILCFKISGQYFGNQLFCENYFNAVTEKCENEGPADH